MKKITVLLLILLSAMIFSFGEVHAYVLQISDDEVVASTAYEGKKIVFLGDSITAGTYLTNEENRYTDIVAAALGFDSFINYGVNGSRITAQSGSTNSFVERYSAMEDGADVVVVFGGINDWMTGTGSLGESTSTNSEEFYGAYNNLLNGLIAKYPGAEIIVMTPFKSMFQTTGSSTPNATTGLTLGDIKTAMVSNATARKVGMIDLYSFIGFDAETNTTDRAKFTTDGVHLTVDGHKRLAKILISFLQKNITTAYTSNLFNTPEMTSGILEANGTVTASETISHTDFIEVEVGKVYVIFNDQTTSLHGQAKVGALYNAEKTLITGLTYPVGFSPNIVLYKIPTGGKYLKINYENSISDNFFVRKLVNYDLNKIELYNGEELLETHLLEYGDSLILPSYQITGYTFVGWYTDSELATLFTYSAPISDDISLYGKWSQNTGVIIVPEEPILTTTEIIYIVIGAVIVIGLLVYLNQPKKKGSRR